MTHDHCIIEWNDSAKQFHATGYRMPYVDDSRGAQQMFFHMSVIDPGKMVHPPHDHAGEEIMFILEGTGEVQIGETKRIVHPMTALFFPEHVLHGLRNVGTSPIRYLVARVPPSAVLGVGAS